MYEKRVRIPTFVVTVLYSETLHFSDLSKTERYTVMRDKGDIEPILHSTLKYNTRV